MQSALLIIFQSKNLEWGILTARMTGLSQGISTMLPFFTVVSLYHLPLQRCDRQTRDVSKEHTALGKAKACFL